jgi:hypothetical protein
LFIRKRFFTIKMQTKSFAFIFKNLDTLWKIVWRKRMMKKKRQTKLVKIKNKCLLPPWVLMIIQRTIGSLIPTQQNTWCSYWKQLENKQEIKQSRFMQWNNCIN